MNVLVFQIISEGKRDALHLKEFYGLDIVSLVVEKAVNYNVDVPQNHVPSSDGPTGMVSFSLKSSCTSTVCGDTL